MVKLFSVLVVGKIREVLVQESIIASIDRVVFIWHKIIESAADRVRYSIPAPILYTDGRLEMKYDFPDSELSRQAE